MGSERTSKHERDHGPLSRDLSPCHPYFSPLSPAAPLPSTPVFPKRSEFPIIIIMAHIAIITVSSLPSISSPAPTIVIYHRRHHHQIRHHHHLVLLSYHQQSSHVIVSEPRSAIADRLLVGHRHAVQHPLPKLHQVWSQELPELARSCLGQNQKHATRQTQHMVRLSWRLHRLVVMNKHFFFHHNTQQNYGNSTWRSALCRALEHPRLLVKFNLDGRDNRRYSGWWGVFSVLMHVMAKKKKAFA